jgi:hypothetical protein
MHRKTERPVEYRELVLHERSRHFLGKDQSGNGDLWPRVRFSVRARVAPERCILEIVLDPDPLPPDVRLIRQRQQRLAILIRDETGEIQLQRRSLEFPQ